MSDFVLKGTFLDTPEVGELRCREGYAVCVNGVCAGVFDELPEEYAALDVQDLTGKLVIPGLTDLHLHAPQYSYAGLAMDLQLIDWLNSYTYPEEKRFEDMVYAKQQYAQLVNDLTQTATTRACVFGTIHTEATLELMRQLDEAGMTCYVGKVNMDRNCPEGYRDPSVELAVREERRWLEACHFEHVKPILTPRFTPAVSNAYMCALGILAQAYKVPVQSHLSENEAEIAWVKELCPNCATYADTYARYGLLGGECPTVMAHCIYSDKKEKQLLHDKGVMIAHCPTSNVNVVAGIAPAAEYVRGGYRIGLGSDVAGGHTLNLFEVMRAAIQMSKLRWLQDQQGEKPLTIREAFYMATAGGGSFFGKVGLFEEGYAFDAVVLDDGAQGFTPEQRLERYAYRGDGKPAAKWIEGRKVL